MKNAKKEGEVLKKNAEDSTRRAQEAQEQLRGLQKRHDVSKEALDIKKKKVEELTDKALVDEKKYKD